MATAMTSASGAFSLAVAPGSYSLNFTDCCNPSPDYPSYFFGDQ